MKVIKSGSGQKGWSTKIICTGKGNGGGGCGAELMVEEPDLYQTLRSDYTGDTDYFVTFTCVECGVETDLENVPSAIHSKIKTNKKAKATTLTRNTPISFSLGSSSKIKIDALQGAINDLKIHGAVLAVNRSASQVNEQPVGKVEILKGAINRVISASEINPESEIYISMENGIELTPACVWVDYAIVLAFVPSNEYIHYVKSQSIVFPLDAVEETRTMLGGFTLNTVGKTLKRIGKVKFADDPHLDLAGISRRQILKEATKKLLVNVMKATVL